MRHFNKTLDFRYDITIYFLHLKKVENTLIKSELYIDYVDKPLFQLILSISKSLTK